MKDGVLEGPQQLIEEESLPNCTFVLAQKEDGQRICAIPGIGLAYREHGLPEFLALASLFKSSKKWRFRFLVDAIGKNDEDEVYSLDDERVFKHDLWDRGIALVENVPMWDGIHLGRRLVSAGF